MLYDYSMITTLREIGASYRKRAGEMLDEVERVLPQIGIDQFVRPAKSCCLRAYMDLPQAAVTFVFTAHPVAGDIKIEIRDGSQHSAQSGIITAALLHRKRVDIIESAMRRTLVRLYLELEKVIESSGNMEHQDQKKTVHAT